MRNKFLIAAIFSISIFTGCDVRKHDKITNNSTPIKPMEIKDPTTVQMIDSAYDFGKVMDGEIVSYNFRFKNTGTKSLIVTNVSASCGCTVPEKPEQPIQPGEIGYIKVKFDSENKVGKTHKSVTVSSNASPAFPELLITGEVNKKIKQ